MPLIVSVADIALLYFFVYYLVPPFSHNMSFSFYCDVVKYEALPVFGVGKRKKKLTIKLMLYLCQR